MDKQKVKANTLIRLEARENYVLVLAIYAKSNLREYYCVLLIVKPLNPDNLLISPISRQITNCHSPNHGFKINL